MFDPAGLAPGKEEALKAEWAYNASSTSHMSQNLRVNPASDC